MSAQAINRTEAAWIYGDMDASRLARSSRLLWVISALFIMLGLWAYFGVLDEVSTGAGKVVPSNKEQMIQSLEGGILAKLYVREDQVVEQGQTLAQLDPTISESDVGESAAKYHAALARSARLTAEVNDTALKFPTELDAYPDLVAAERRLYDTRRTSLEQSLKWIRESLDLAKSELTISERLSKVGAASNVEVLRLKRQMVELELKQVEVRSEYLVKAREDLSEANSDVASLQSVVRGRADSLSRLTVRSPVRGIVKNIEVSTIGGVVPPNGPLMDIIPLDDVLMIEARISPRDIAFIHPDQAASVKITAYDFSIYGGLEGKVSTISPDTIQDEKDPEIHYYRVLIKTDDHALVNKAGSRFPIVPGMVATVDIHTGRKTIADYLLKPFNKAQEALRER